MRGPTLLTRPDGTRIAYEDHVPLPLPHPAPPGSPPETVLLLHGLAGHRSEWNDLAGRLRTAGHRVVTYDARGHGESTRRPDEVTRASCVADAAALIEELSLTPVTLTGQSMGGRTALLLAAARPDLVKSLILVEAGPAPAPPDLPAHIAGWLDSWPTPFPSFEAATRFFGNEAWASGLERREDGWWARVDKDVMVESIRELAMPDDWPKWDGITCPTLVVKGANGTMRHSEFEAMQARRPDTTRLLTIPDAAHDVHLDQPKHLYDGIAAFLRNPRTVPARTSSGDGGGDDDGDEGGHRGDVRGGAVHG